MKNELKRLVPRYRTPTHKTLEDGSKEPSPVRHSLKDECDINQIIKKYRKTGSIDVSMKRGTSGDFSKFTDLQTSLLQIAEAQTYFDALPSNVRDRFRNDPTQFYNFASDARNESEMRSLGLLRSEVRETLPDSSGGAPKPFKTSQADPAPKGGQQPEPAAGKGPNA